MKLSTQWEILATTTWEDCNSCKILTIEYETYLSLGEVWYPGFKNIPDKGPADREISIRLIRLPSGRNSLQWDKYIKITMQDVLLVLNLV